jgi:hypothetical protein
MPSQPVRSLRCTFRVWETPDFRYAQPIVEATSEGSVAVAPQRQSSARPSRERIDDRRRIFAMARRLDREISLRSRNAMSDDALNRGCCNLKNTVAAMSIRESHLHEPESCLCPVCKKVMRLSRVPTLKALDTIEFYFKCDAAITPPRS